MQSLCVRSFYRSEDPLFETIYNHRMNAPSLWCETNYVRCGAPHREKQEGKHTLPVVLFFSCSFPGWLGSSRILRVRTPSCMVFMSWWRASFREGWMYEAVHERSVLHVINDSEWCQLALLQFDMGIDYAHAGVSVWLQHSELGTSCVGGPFTLRTPHGPSAIAETDASPNLPNPQRPCAKLPKLMESVPWLRC